MKKGHSLDAVLTMMLFGLFTGCVLMVLMMGAQSYQGVSTTVKENYEERTCLQYIATKVNHYSGADAVAVTTFGDGAALALYETIDQCDYVTYIYFYDGQVKELFCEWDVVLEPEAGFTIMEVEALEIQAVSQGLISLSCTGSGGTAQLYVGLHQEVTV